jgi:hypothetical protein
MGGVADSSPRSVKGAGRVNRRKQIPRGNDRKKGKNNSKSRKGNGNSRSRSSAFGEG